MIGTYWYNGEKYRAVLRHVSTVRCQCNAPRVDKRRSLACARGSARREMWRAPNVWYRICGRQPSTSWFRRATNRRRNDESPYCKRPPARHHDAVCRGCAVSCEHDACQKTSETYHCHINGLFFYFFFYFYFFEKKKKKQFQKCDRFLGAETYAEISFHDIVLPHHRSPHTELLDLRPLPVAAVHDEAFANMYSYTHFNPIQTQVSNSFVVYVGRWCGFDCTRSRVTVGVSHVVAHRSSCVVGRADW